MRYALLVMGAPYSHQAAHSALRFAQAIIRKGHHLDTVFFYHDGVHNASILMSPPQDELHMRNAWAELHEAHGTRLEVCIAAALRRGLLDASEAKRHAKTAHSVEAPFELTGLGQLLELQRQSDRLVTFAP
ncbi:sulfurtransferase complex subunit TusD [Vreelandella rituensis]|uniref:Sulfurtransferase complex subunit TusD n=1 Tax=Vreelandella rituensis TaxID=2282306 RepID=A0A368U4N3_9GAMM|nr:sulfurtransferase complex subunit TusD [Halomonas rituensis]RCV92129.1 sulfurtransferase complex subunit TusD [Halomonas rituensis]